MIDLCAFIGAPINFHNKCSIYPPTVKEVVSNEQFSLYLHLLTLEQEDMEQQFIDQLKEGKSVPTPFEYLLLGSKESKDFAQSVKDAFQFFIHEEVEFLFDKKIIIIGNLAEALTKAQSIDDIVYITSDEYFEFQNAIRAASGLEMIEPPEAPDPNEHPKVRAMKAKARYRDYIKRKKGSKKSKDGISLKETIVAICCMGLGISPLNIGEMSFASVSEIMSTYQRKEKYDIDIRSLLAGAKKEKVNPKYWMKKQ